MIVTSTFDGSRTGCPSCPPQKVDGQRIPLLAGHLAAELGHPQVE